MGVAEAFPYLTQKVLLRDLALLQEYLRGGRCSDPHFMEGLSRGETFELLLNNKRGDSPVFQLLIYGCIDHRHVRYRGIGDKCLGPVKNPHVPFLNGTVANLSGSFSGGENISIADFINSMEENLQADSLFSMISMLKYFSFDAILGGISDTFDNMIAEDSFAYKVLPVINKSLVEIMGGDQEIQLITVTGATSGTFSLLYDEDGEGGEQGGGGAEWEAADDRRGQAGEHRPHQRQQHELARSEVDPCRIEGLVQLPFPVAGGFFGVWVVFIFKNDYRSCAVYYNLNVSLGYGIDGAPINYRL